MGPSENLIVDTKFQTYKRYRSASIKMSVDYFESEETEQTSYTIQSPKHPFRKRAAERNKVIWCNQQKHGNNMESFGTIKITIGTFNTRHIYM